MFLLLVFCVLGLLLVVICAHYDEGGTDLKDLDRMGFAAFTIATFVLFGVEYKFHEQFSVFVMHPPFICQVCRENFQLMLC